MQESTHWEEKKQNGDKGTKTAGVNMIFFPMPLLSEHCQCTTAGVQWPVLPGYDGRPLRHRGVGGSQKVLPGSQRQSGDLPCSVEPQERAPSQPAARYMLLDTDPWQPSVVITLHKKMSRSLMLFWGSVLRRIPGSRLWLGRLPQTVRGRSSSTAVLPNSKSHIYSEQDFNLLMSLSVSESLEWDAQ